MPTNLYQFQFDQEGNIINGLVFGTKIKNVFKDILFFESLKEIILNLDLNSTPLFFEKVQFLKNNYFDIIIEPLQNKIYSVKCFQMEKVHISDLYAMQLDRNTIHIELQHQKEKYAKKEFELKLALETNQHLQQNLNNIRNFSASAYHEINTMLNRVNSLTKEIEIVDQVSSNRINSLRNLTQSIGLISKDIIDAAKLQASKFKLRSEVFNLNDIFIEKVKEQDA